MDIVETWETGSTLYAIIEHSADYLELVVSKKFEAMWVEAGDLCSFGGRDTKGDFDTPDEAREFLLEVIESDDPDGYKRDARGWNLGRIYTGVKVQAQ